MRKKDKKVYTAALLAAIILGLGCSGSKPETEVAANAVAPAAESTPGAAPASAAKEPGAPAAVAKPAPKGVAPPPPVILEAGTAVKVRSTTTLSTKTNAAGDPFHGSLAEPLTVNGKVVADKGAKVQGVVATADPGGRVKGVARISVRLTSIETDKGMVSVQTSTVGREAKSTKRNDAIKVGVGSGIGAAIGAIAGGGRGAAIGAGAGAGAGTGVVLATRGEPAVLPAETVMTFRLTESVEVK
jgi:hypothetical protein